MSILKKIYFKWRAFKMRSRAKSEAHKKLFSSPLAYTRAMNEIDCLINGHQWSSEFNPKTDKFIKIKYFYCFFIKSHLSYMLY